MGRIKGDNLGEKACNLITDSHTADGGTPVPSGSLKCKLTKTFSTPSSWVRHGYDPVNHKVPRGGQITQEDLAGEIIHKMM